ncbi:DUF2946 family protein [Bordetella petrii]|uniref:DUF2946 domain-containing protein n=1 Tax=Bordetella petrii (strain ATCC BAA-461 / DSM 12804 / CCUG 43448 / CIP 107267 / Se-1111R) TaxID=340100 RepID=A9I8N1_BORPD|nr:DUF2946 family protein [Bordetella petrii]CAP41267.1 conserved hypothetical protein [Bordetella petrii]
MDSSVRAALAKWPDVPAVYGWLSLDERGRWRLHPVGDATGGGPGESIENTQILDFIGRNYDHDDAGRWFFQNGPQRVYVRLDAAPFLLRRADDGVGLVTHTGRTVRAVTAWLLDDTGRLYAQTDAGPAMVEGRELPALLDSLRDVQGRPLADALESAAAGISVSHPALAAPAPLYLDVAQADIPARLAFVANPRA